MKKLAIRRNKARIWRLMRGRKLDELSQDERRQVLRLTLRNAALKAGVPRLKERP